MRIKIVKNYLVFPTSKYAKRKRMRFFEEEKEVYYLNIPLDIIHPEFSAYIDMRPFLGKTLDIEISPSMEIQYVEADELLVEPEDGLRPHYHFTAPRGWINDPNGLVFADGKYHLFYQHNPTDTDWQNMHWGHAVSEDLFAWEHLPEALYPDDFGTMFSGSALVDEKNLLGLQTGAQKTVLLYYTAAGQKFTQCLAYSTDGLKTIRKYEGNPVVPFMEGPNRDPKVVWCEERGQYVMSLYMTKAEYALFASDDLITWKEFQRFEIKGDSECPNFFPVTAQDGVRKWVAYGASGVYLVGDFAHGQFVPSQSEKRLASHTQNYAAQVYTDMPDGRVIFISWIRWGRRAKTYSQQLGMPCNFGLKKVDGEYYVTLQPVAEIEKYTKNKKEWSDLTFQAGEEKKRSLNEKTVRLRLKGQYDTSVKLTATVFGVPVSVDAEKNEISVGGFVNPLSVDKKKIDVMLFADSSTIETYCDDGAIAFAVSDNAISDENLPYATIRAENACSFELASVVEYEKRR